MTYLALESVGFRDDATLDATGRLRVSGNFPMFDNNNQYGINTRDWVGQVTGTGIQTHLPNEGALLMSTGGTASGAGAIRQTRLNWRCFPGRSSFVYISGLLDLPKANVVKRVGYYDLGDGIFIEVNGTDIRFVKRTSISGAPSDAVFAAQDAWNIDKFDGTGPSGVTLDLTQYQTFFFDIMYTSFGQVRCGFVIEGRHYIAHEFHSGNTPLSSVWKTGNLPIRGEIFNSGTAASTTTIRFRGSALQIEGGTGELNRGYLNTGTTGATKTAVTTRRPVLSIRAKALLNELPNRGWVVPYDFTLLATTNDAFFEVLVGATLTGDSWVSAAPDSCGEYDISATALTGGLRVLSGFLIAGQGSTALLTASSLIDNYPTSVDSLLGTQTVYTIAVTSFTGTSNVSAAINWREIY